LLKGVVKCKELTYCTKGEIVEELKFKTQGVVDCADIQVRSDTGDCGGTNTFILTFHSSAHQST